jgi:hypothetical protein
VEILYKVSTYHWYFSNVSILFYFSHVYKYRTILIRIWVYILPFVFRFHFPLFSFYSLLYFLCGNCDLSRIQRSKERSKVSRHLTEEAERYFEDFLSNVDDTDFSSFDEERSDSSSCRKDFLSNPYSRSSLIELHETPVTESSSSSPETDGVVLPWLQWETGLQTSPLKPKPEVCIKECRVRDFWSCELMFITP